ncbi:MAG: hypothetical protein ABI625_23825 [bacterium]
MRYRSHDIEVSYAFRANCTSDCGLSPGESFAVNSPESFSAATGGIIAAPSSPLFFQGGRETSHHFTISVPIR